MATNIRAGIITASDRAWRGEREDQSGPLLKSLLETISIEVVAYWVLSDELEGLKKILCYLADQFPCDLIFTTGGTGLGPRDNTPEATRAVIEKEIPGIPRALLETGLKQTKFAMLSRAVAGIRGKTLMINLPGNPEAVQAAFEVLEPVLPHAVELIRGEVGDCRTLSQSLSHSSH